MLPIHFNSWWDIHNDRLSHVSTQQTQSTHGSGRALLGDWARLGNSYAFTECGSLKLIYQFDETVKYVSTARPYYFQDDVVISEDNTKLNPHLFIAEREVTLNKYRHLRQITNKGVKEKNKSVYQSYVKSVEKGITVKKLTEKISRRIPNALSYVAENYSELLVPKKYVEACNSSSFMYSGGCIKHFTLFDEMFIVRCVGLHLGSLRIDKYDGTLIRVYPVNDDVSVEIRPIFEIDCVTLNNECRLLIRRSDEIQLFSIKIVDDKLTVISVGLIKESCSFPWLSARLNDSWVDELVTTSSDGICRYMIETMNYDWNFKSPCLSSVIDSWSEIRPFLPQQWIYTNRSECNLIDCRRNPFDSAKEMFTIKHPSLNCKESFCHTSVLFDAYYFHLFSSYNCNLLDIRMPGKQVSQWSVPLLNPVSYSSTSVVGSNIQCVLGAQMESRHCIFDITRPSMCKSTALCSEEADCPSIMSLGLITLQNHNNIEVLTLDHHGKILCHKYGRDESKRTPDTELCYNFNAESQPQHINDNSVLIDFNYGEDYSQSKNIDIVDSESEDDISTLISDEHGTNDFDIVSNILLNHHDRKTYMNDDVFNITLD